MKYNFLAVCLLPVVSSFFVRQGYPYGEDDYDYGGGYDQRYIGRNHMTGSFIGSDVDRKTVWTPNGMQTVYDYSDINPLYDRDNVAAFPGMYQPHMTSGPSYHLYQRHAGYRYYRR